MRDTNCFILRRLRRTTTSHRAGIVLLAFLIATSAVVTPVSAVSAQTADDRRASVEVVRYGGADRYETSLLVAEAVAADAGGRLDHVVLVSGRHWHDAVVAAGAAGRVLGPVLMTPPDELREDALEFLKRVGATQVTVVTTGEWPDTTVSPSVLTALEEAGLTVGRLGGDDRYLTGASVARWMVEAQSQDVSGKIAIVASDEVFADALVAGPMSARRLIPVLLSERDELHAEVGMFLEDAGIERVVLMGGTAALSAGVEADIANLGIKVDRMAGATRFETAILTGEFAAELVGEGCFDSGSVGLARARVPFDSFSAAALMARRCAPLVLTDPHKVPASTVDYLDGVRSRSEDEVMLMVFGGNAAVSQAAVDAYLDTEPQGEETDEGSGTAELALSCGGNSADAPAQLVSGSTFAREPAWSPDCTKIAYIDAGALMVARADGSNAAAVLRLAGTGLYRPAWSPDGTKIALSVLSWEGGVGFQYQRRHIYVVNADGTNPTKITQGTVEDDSPTWSPDGTRIAFHRTTWQDRSVSPPVGTDRYIVIADPDGANQVEINQGGIWESRPAWSPDGTRFAIIANAQLAVMNVDGTQLRSWGVAPHWLSSHSWSPAGTHITLSRVTGPRDDLLAVDSDISIIDVATGDTTDITAAEGTEINPAWSPDGTRIMFNTYNEEGRDTRVWVVGADHRTG